MDIARQQQAKLWELRAVVSLGRLWFEQGKQAETRDSLEKVVCWFATEDEETDLQEAWALLERCSA